MAAAALCLATALAAAAPKAHVHGLVTLDVAIDANSLTVQLDAPLDSLLGFERRPRNDAERRAADALLALLKDSPALVRPAAAAACRSNGVSVESAVLQAAPAAAAAAAAPSEHAELQARFEFVCEQPDKLTTIELGLFAAFARVQQIQVQLAGPRGQLRRVLKRPDGLLQLRR